MIRGLDAIDTTAYQIDQARGTVEFTRPFPERAGIP